MKKSPIRKVSKKQAKRQRDLAKIPLPENGLCEKCGQRPDWRGLSKHHIVKRSACGSDGRENLIWLCGKCHAQEEGIKEV